MVEITLSPGSTSKLRSVDLPYTIHLYGVTEEMFDDLVDEDTKAELLDGVMIVHSPATIEHDDIGGFVRTLMRMYARRKQLGKVLGPDSLVRLRPGRRFAPDAYFLKKDRVPPRKVKEFEGAPDLVVEVLSPSNRDFDLEDKRQAYREAGVSEIWFLDPANEQVIVDSRRGKKYTERIVETGRITSTVLQGFWLEADWLWMEELPDDLECLEKILEEK
jgi:Uma2 family endonuclease